MADGAVWLKQPSRNLLFLCGPLVFCFVGLWSVEVSAIVCNAEYQRTQLVERYEQDQSARELVAKAEDPSEAFRQVLRVDANNQLWLGHVADICGWPSESRVGSRARVLPRFHGHTHKG